MTIALLRKIMNLIREEIPSDRMMVVLMNVTRQAFFRDTHPFAPAGNDELEMEIIRRVLDLRQPVIIGDSRTDLRLPKQAYCNAKEKENSLCVPFALKNKAEGVLFLKRTNSFHPFSFLDLDFLLTFLKPIKLILENCVDFKRLGERVVCESEPLLLGKSEAFHHLVALIERVKDRDAPVFIYGESGTGKEVVARAIHQRGIRRAGKFVPVNCGAIPDLLLESELFGHARGAFTGAVRDKPGLIEEADGGTFFLDEICDLSPPLQAKLLRLLQESEIRRIGENHMRRVNTRFISATNKDIEEQMRLGNFREDLYYRLKIITIELSPLRQRKEDLLFLLNYFLDKYCQDMERDRAYFSPRALELLLDYAWPGNVRELQSEIQRCLILSGDDDLIKEEHLSPKVNPQAEVFTPSVFDFSQAKAEFEKRFLNQALARWNFNRAKTAENIGLSRQGLFKLTRKHNILLPRRKQDTHPSS